RSMYVMIVVLLGLITSVAYAGSWSGYPTVNVRVNGKPYQGDVPAILVESRTFLPVRGIGEAVGADVTWDQATQTVSIAMMDAKALLGRAESAEAQVAKLQAELKKTQDELQKANERSKQTGGGTPSNTGSRQELIAQLKTRVFRLDVFDGAGTKTSSGSAVAVGMAELVTNYHVIADASKVIATDDQGHSYDITGQLASSEELDVAVLRVNGQLTPVELRTQDAPTVGEDILAIGSPEGLTNTVSTGIVSGTRDWKGITILQLSAPVSHGSSGGGLFDVQGRLVGITFASLVDGQNLNFAIPMKNVVPIIETARTATPKPLPGVSNVTPANVEATIAARYPTFKVAGKSVSAKYSLVRRSAPQGQQAPYFLSIDLDNTQYRSFLEGLLTDFNTGKADVEAYMINVGKIFQQAYPGKSSDVDIFHIGMYSSYPSSYTANEVSYRNGGWQVIHLSVRTSNESGVWRSSWNE
ncbi:MAG: copper amine oxidase, partial [Firmicutes bacterium]|nr:copper amine oxidase [Bacillota bacterium]